MEKILVILCLLLSGSVYTQTNFSAGFSMGGNDLNYGSSFFYNTRNVILGSVYLFDEWNNSAEIHTLADERFLVRNINLNINRNAFEAKLTGSDSLFSFNFNNIKQIVINDKIYKNYYYNDDNRVYEIIYETEKFSIMKGFSVKLVKGHYNPMVRISNDKYAKFSSYFIKLNNSIKPFKLKKKSVINLLSADKNNISRLESYVSNKNLSYKREKDVVQILDYAFNQTRSRRIGNRHEYFAPHGCFPCKGKDEWVVIAIRDDVEWRSFCIVLGRPDLAQDSRFKDPVSRHKNQDDFDPFIKEWTRHYNQTEIMENLQNNGIPCGAVLNSLGMLSDPNFRERGFFETIDHSPETFLGRREYVSRGWNLSDGDVKIRNQAPQLGEANDYVLREILGLGEPDISDLDQKEAIGKQLSDASVPSMVPLSRQEDLGWVAGYDPDYKDKLK